MKENNATIDALLVAAAPSLLDDDVEYFNSIDTSKTEVSAKTTRKIKHSLRQKRLLEIPGALRTATAVFFIVCTVGFVLCLSVEAVRVELWSTVTKWFDEFISVDYVTETDPLNRINEYREPFVSLKGFEKEYVLKGKTTQSIQYKKDGVVSILYSQSTISENSITEFNGKECTVSKLKINSYDAVVFAYEDGRFAITWHDDSYRYSIISHDTTIDSDTLIELAESVE